MKHHAHIYPLAVALIMAILTASTLHAQCPKPFVPSEATLISNPENKMSHCPSFVISDKGEAYVMHYGSCTDPKEHSGNLSVKMDIVHFPVDNWRNPDIKRIHFIGCGETVGDYRQEGRAPYDPTLFIDGNKLICTFNGYENGEPVICVRKMNMKNDKLENKIERCTMSYRDSSGRKQTVTLNNSGLKKCYADLGIAQEVHGLSNLCLDKAFVEYDGWRYNVIFAWCCTESRPLVVRTKDCISYELAFFCPEFILGSSEATIAIVNDEFYIQCRSARPKDRGKAGTWIGKYSADGKCLVKPWKIGTVESRPALVNKDGKIYSFYNVKPDVKLSEEGKRVYRSHLRISEIDRFCQARDGWDITSDDSIQYYALSQYGGKTYIVFVEDRQHKADSSRKGNVSICEVKL